MENKFLDGLIAGSLTIAAAGTVLFLVPSRAGAVLIGGIAGAAGMAIATQQQTKRLSNQIQQVRQELSQRVAETEDRLVATQIEWTAFRQQISQSKDSPSLPSSSNRAKQETSPTVVPAIPVSEFHLGFSNGKDAIAWFSAQKIAVENYRQADPCIDAAFDQLAIYLGEQYSNLAPLYKQIKRSILAGGQIRLSLLDKSPETIALYTQFCSKLRDASLLSFYVHSKAEKLIMAAPQRRGDFDKFLTGEWFERFIYHKVASLLSARELKYDCLINSNIVFSNGDRFELDLLFIVEGSPLWIECKSGKDYNAHLAKYSNHRKILDIPKTGSILVILDIPDEQTVTLTSFWDITVVNQNTIIPSIETALKSFVNQDNSPNTQPSAKSTAYKKLTTFFNHLHLRPLPEHREVVIQCLVEVIDHPEYQPQSLNQIKDTLAQRLSEEIKISRVKLHEILKALRQSECLLDEQEQPVESFQEPVATLLSSNPITLAEKCIESYVVAILSDEPDYFDHPLNVQRFEQTVGGKIPDAQRMEQLQRSLDPPSSTMIRDLAIADSVA
jgi:hypothetical protein